MLRKVQWIAYCAGLGLLAGCVGTKAPPGDTRVALWITGPATAHEAIVSLAEARVSVLPGVQLLERREIDRVIAEQGLTAGGFSGSENAVKVGAILGADLVAHIELDPDGKSSLGMTVFDARTGARLWDSPLPELVEPAVDAIAAAVLAASTKTALHPAQRRVVCLLAARNAELPRAMDQFCEATGQLFERELTRNRRVLVLERRRLDALNRERELAPASSTADLLVSVTHVEIDINRSADGSGLRAVATLTDGESRGLGRVTVDFAETEASTLAQTLAAQVADRLGASSQARALDAPQRRREAQRFLHEARARESHHEAGPAWRAAEAAHALDPGNVEIEAMLARCLLHEGSALLGSPGEVSREQLLDALEFGLRSVGLRAARLRIALAEVDWKQMNEEELRASATAVSMVRYAELAYRRCRLHDDGKVRQTFAQLCEQFLAMDRERFEGWARVATEQPSLFPMFTMIVQGWHGLTVRYLAPEPTDFLRRLDRYLRRWLEAGNAHPPTVDHASRIAQLFERIAWVIDPWSFLPIANVYTNDAIQPAHLESLKPIAEELAASPSPVISAQGKKLGDRLAAWTGGENPDERETAYYRDCERISEIPDPSQRVDAYIALIDRMLAQKYVHATSVEMAARFVSRHRLQSETLASRFDRVEAAADNPDFTFSKIGFERQSLKRHLAAHKVAMAKARSIADNGANTPWAAPVQLLDLAAFPQTKFLSRTVVSGDALLALGMRFGTVFDSKNNSESEMTLSLIRASLASGSGSLVSTIAVRLPHHPGLVSVVHAEVSGARFYALLDVQGIPPSRWQLFEFPLDGGSPARIDTRFALPDPEINSFTVHNGTLYLGLPGYIVACDLASDRINVIASSRRADKQSDLDGGEVFRARFMIPDAKRHRIVLVVEPHQRPLELWSLEPSTGRLTRFHVASSRFTFSRMDRSDEDVVVLGNECQIHALHLDTGRLEKLAMDKFCGGRIDEKLPLGWLSEREWTVGPLLIHDGWLWSANAMGRVSFANARTEQFPPVGPPGPEGGPHIDAQSVGCLAATPDGKALILATVSGAWRLPLRATDSQ